ncbi:hypothetical protein K2X05_10640 [bacterium]|nr:hypothetical protein [bacterium]
MDALKFKMKYLSLCLFMLAACSKNDDEIDPQAKNNLLSNTMLLSVKQQCLPVQIIDEEDLPLLARQGYTLSPNNEYCLPPVNNNDGDDTISNCIRDVFLDEADLAYLLSRGYVLNANGDYCLVIGGGTTSGGGTTGATTGGTTSGGTTTGGSTSAGTTSGGSTMGGTDNGGGTVTGGTTTGGSTSGGMTSGGMTSGGETSGGVSTGGMTSGGSTSGGMTSGGSTSGGSSTGGMTSGGSTSGGDECRPGNNGHGNDRDGNDSSNPGHSNNGDGTDQDGRPGKKCPPVVDCEMNVIPGLENQAYFEKCEPWNVPVDRMCSKIRTSSGRYKLKDRIALVLRVVKRVKTVEEVEVCKEKKTAWWQSSKGDDDDDSDGKNHKHDKNCKHDGKKDEQKDEKKIVCKKEKKETITMIPICESKDTAKIKKDVLERRRLDFSACDISGHNKKDLYVTLFSPVEGGDLPISQNAYDNVRFFEKDSGKRGKDELSFIMYGSRDERYAKINEKIIVITDDNPDFNSNVNKKDCDMKASPLIVHINPNHDQARYVELSSMDDGVDFNILGFNAEPRANAPKQISWLNSDQYMFLVKPNKKGRVEGVDEMFGDNTRGPDKDFAANGFLALAKFDSNGDGLINSKDGVYRSLRLWKDKNFDGVGTPDELFSLERMSVKTIDLNYDPGFYERDAYGNETIYKSVIQYNDGSLDLIFDLWFNYKK